MKKFINKINEKATAVAIKAQTTLDNVKGEGYIDTGVKIIIGVVIGGVILAGLYLLFNSTIMPTLSSKIQGMFNYGGATYILQAPDEHGVDDIILNVLKSID